MKTNLFKPLLDIFLPEQCMLCENNYFNTSSALCECCRERCHPCPIGPFVFSKEHKGALYFYDMAIRDALKSAKFQRNFASARMLGQLMREELLKNEHTERIKAFAPAGICYVPTHWVRRSIRGLDMPSYFAHILSEHLGIPLIHALTKSSLKEAQSSLHSKSSRLRAVKDRFKTRTRKKIYERLVLVDDIVTTGATFDECTRVLKKITNNVRCLAFAKTP